MRLQRQSRYSGENEAIKKYLQPYSTAAKACLCAATVVAALGGLTLYTGVNRQNDCMEQYNPTMDHKQLFVSCKKEFEPWKESTDYMGAFSFSLAMTSTFAWGMKKALEASVLEE